MRLAVALPVLFAAATAHAASLSPLTDDPGAALAAPTPDAAAAQDPHNGTLSAQQPGLHPLVRVGPPPGGTFPGLLLARDMLATPAAPGPVLPGR